MYVLLATKIEMYVPDLAPTQTNTKPMYHEGFDTNSDIKTDI